MFDGHNDRIIREHNSLAWAAWHTAAWSRSDKLPRFQTVLAKKKTPLRAQSPDQLMDMVRLLNAMHGGTESKK